MSVRIVVLTHAERCPCGSVLPTGVRAGWDDVSDEILCTPCLDLALSLDDDVPALDISLPHAS